MNGFFNLLAALLFGGAVVWAGYQYFKSDDGPGTQVEEQVTAGNDAPGETAGEEESPEDIARQRLAEAEQAFAEDCEAAGANCDVAGEDDADGREDPYTPGVARQTYPADSGAPVDFGELADTGESQAGQSQASESESRSANTPRIASYEDVGETPGEAGAQPAEASGTSAADDAARPNTRPVRVALAGDQQADSTQPSPTAGLNRAGNRIGTDKPDTKDYFTENGKRIDKPDTKEYFTETRRLIDKPDTKDFYTENRPMPQRPVGKPLNPCIREDGSVYTGPGTVQNPFADINPCLPEKAPTGIAENPCIAEDGSIYTGPGTARNPMAPVNPCLPEQPKVAQGPCVNEDGTPYTGPGTAQNPLAEISPCQPEQPTAIAQTPASDVFALPKTEYYPVEPVRVATRCVYNNGGYTANPVSPGEGRDWVSEFGCYGVFPVGGFGPQPTLSRTSDYP